MFYTEIFDGTTWNRSSSHTQEVDRDAQYQRFLDLGTDPATIRKTQDE